MSKEKSNISRDDMDGDIFIFGSPSRGVPHGPSAVRVSRTLNRMANRPSQEGTPTHRQSYGDGDRERLDDGHG